MSKNLILAPLLKSVINLSHIQSHTVTHTHSKSHTFLKYICRCEEVMVGKEAGRGSQSGLDFLWSVKEALMDSDGLELKILFVQRHKHKSSCVTSECF